LSFGQAEHEKEKKMYLDLESESPEVRAAAASAIIEGRREDASQVALVVEKYLTASRPATVRDSMLLLGKLRASEYVALLVRNLTFHVSYKDKKRPPGAGDTPAIQALIDIGAPALKPVLERASAEDDVAVHAAAAAVFEGVLGRPWAAALFAEQIRAAQRPEVRRRVEEIVRQLDLLPR
jgi:hypothetical protein